MTLKFVAIVILALLGLSSVMSAKAFRVLVCSLGALCIVVAFAIAGLADRSPETVTPGVLRLLASKLQAVFSPESNTHESAENTSERILGDIRSGRRTADENHDGASVGSKRQRQFLTISPAAEVDQLGKLRVWIGMKVQQYLDDYKKKSNEIGVSLLEPKNLNFGLLKWALQRHPETKEVRLVLVFDSTFDEHIRLSGRRITKKARLSSAAAYAAAGGTLLCLAFGSLKVVNGRSAGVRDSDYLHTSKISMV